MKEGFLLPGQHFKIYYERLFFRVLTHVRIPTHRALQLILLETLLLDQMYGFSLLS